MRKVLNAVAAILITMTIAVSAAAHSPEDLKKILNSREKYFQSIDREAPGFTLQNADGLVRSLSDYRGKVVVLHFIYTRCPDVCPLHAERIAEIQSMINQTPMKDHVKFITITTDPHNDTSDVMRAYAPAHGLIPDNWVFLTKTARQPEDATRSVAAKYGHKFTKVGNDYQMHSVVTHVIDRKGGWRANFHGLRFAPTNLVLFINALINAENKPHDHGKMNIWDRIRDLF